MDPHQRLLPIVQVLECMNLRILLPSVTDDSVPNDSRILRSTPVVARPHEQNRNLANSEARPTQK
jgi:hypothetical protein